MNIPGLKMPKLEKPNFGDIGKPTIGFGVITRNKDIFGLQALLECVRGSVDKIHVTVADKKKPTEELVAMVTEYGGSVSYFEWCMDFAAARNFNMQQCKEDWYMWADTDDLIDGLGDARKMLAGLSADVQFVLCTYEYSRTPTGQVGTKHPKERFIRNNGVCVWKGKLHESCVSESPSKGVFCDSMVWKQNKVPGGHRESSERNIVIVENEIREQIEATGKADPRTVFNLGMAYASIAQLSQEKEDWERTLRAFMKYIELSGWDQHAYMAWKYAGIAEMALGRMNEALTSFVEAWKLQPSYSDAYSMLGSIWEALNKPENAEAMYRAALLLGKDNEYASDVETSKLVPLYGLARLAAFRGDLDGALMLVEEGEKYAGLEDQNFAPLKTEIKRIKEMTEEMKREVARLDALPAGEQFEAYEELVPATKSHPLLIAWRRSKKWKHETDGKEVSIFAMAWEEWSPETAKTGIGGSEEAIIYLSQCLHKLGYHVHVYGNHGTEAKDYDGVVYHPYWEWSPEEATDIFISWRNPEILDLPIQAKKKYLWLHDTNPESMVLPRVGKVDKVIVLSQAHADLFPRIPKEKLLLSANGILPEQFDQDEKRNPHQLAYVSAPDRGLEMLLTLWPKIKEQVPDAEFYWAYGWNSYDKIQAHNPHAMTYKAHIQELLKQPGCHELGRIGHEDVAKLLLQTGVWGYPTEFYEIFCISAVKAQAAGAIPVCTTVGALNEVVQFGTKVLTKEMYKDEASQKEFVDAVIKAMKEPDHSLRVEMMEWARNRWTWQAVAEQWDEEFKTGSAL